MRCRPAWRSPLQAPRGGHRPHAASQPVPSTRCRRHGREGHLASRHVSRQVATAVHAYARQALQSSAQPLQSWEGDFFSNSNLSAPAALATEALQEFDLDAARSCLEQSFMAAAQTVEAAGGCDMSRSGSTAVVCMVLPDRWAGLRGSGCRLCSGRAQHMHAGFPLDALAAVQPEASCRHSLPMQVETPKPPEVLTRARFPSAPAPRCSVVAAWAGDSRAVLGTLDGSEYYVTHTQDHKPGRLQEMARILAAGGKVMRSGSDKRGHPTGELGPGAEAA